MTEIIKVSAGSSDYHIHIGKRKRHELTTFIQKPYDQIVIVTDTNVKKLYLDDCLQALQTSFNVHVYVLPAGEQSKSMEQFQKLQSFLLDQQVSRESAIIALGGGVVGDLAGFVAATYMRGIDLIQLPTSLLAHDSSIGGKVAINLNGFKNIVGSFYPPHQVVFDIEMLNTLSKQEKRSGLAEMIKHGLIADSNLYKTVMQEIDHEIDLTFDHFQRLLIQSIRVKKEIVVKDEREANIRAYLNFGHTLGHALEMNSTSQKVTHGECVMLGMFFALWVSKNKYAHIHSFSFQPLMDWINLLEFPLSLKDQKAVDLIQYMRNDKKNTDNHIRMVLLDEVEAPYLQTMTVEKTQSYLDEFIYLWNQGEIY